MGSHTIKFTWAVTEHRDGGMLVGTSHGVDLIKNGVVEKYLDLDTTYGKNAIRMLEYDSEDNLWISTGHGLFKVAPDKTFEDMGIGGLLLDMAEEKDGTIWLVGWGKHILRYRNDTFTNFEPGTPINSIQIDNDGEIWLASWSKGLLRFNGDSTATQFSTEEGIAITTLWNVLVDDEGTVWCATYGSGVDQLVNERFSVIDESNGLANNVVNQIAIDEEGALIWVATEGGLSRIDEEGFVTNYTEANGLYNSKVQSVVVDSNGLAYCALYGGKKSLYRIENGVLSDGLVPGGFSLMIDSKGNLWIGRDGGGAVKYEDVHEDAKGESFSAEGLKISKIRVHKVFEDSDENIWFGVDLNTWHVYDRFDGEVHAGMFPEHLSIESGVFIEEDKWGSKWLTLGSTGIYRCTYQNGKISIHDSIRVEDGLLANEVAGMMAEDNKLWINTISGFSILDLTTYYSSRELEFIHYSRDKGFVGEGFGNIVRKNEDEVLITTTKGVLVFHESKDRSIRSQPFTNIISLKLDKHEIDWFERTNKMKSTVNVPKEVTLPYDDNHLTFGYIGISFSGPEYVRYQYKLEGFDNDWSPLTDQGEITYSNIPAGDYIFKVKSVNLDGVWDETPDSVIIHITPPFWQNLVVYSLDDLHRIILSRTCFQMATG
jgi:streptogramin lyase